MKHYYYGGEPWITLEYDVRYSCIYVGDSERIIMIKHH